MAQQKEAGGKLDEMTASEAFASEGSEDSDVLVSEVDSCQVADEASASMSYSEPDASSALDLPEIGEEDLIDGSGAYCEENDDLLEEPCASSKRPLRLRFAFAAALALVIAFGIGGVAYAGGHLASLLQEGDALVSSDAWITLNVSHSEPTALLEAGSSLTQTVAVENKIVGNEGELGCIAEDAYVRIHVAIPADVNDFDGDIEDDILQLLSMEGSVSVKWVATSSYDTNIHGVSCHVRVFVYPAVLASGSATEPFKEEFRINPLCDVNESGSTVLYIKDGARFECDGTIPVYVCSEAVQADAWNPAGTTGPEKAQSVLDAAFGAIDKNYQCKLNWKLPTL